MPWEAEREWAAGISMDAMATSSYDLTINSGDCQLVLIHRGWLVL